MAMSPTRTPQPPQRKALRGVFFSPSAPTGYVAYFIRNTTGEVIRMGTVREHLWDEDLHREMFEWLNRKDPISEYHPLALVLGSSA